MVSADDLGPLPMLHPRHELVQRAKVELMALLIDWSRKHELTISEELSLLSDEMSSSLHRCVNTERRKKKER